MADLKGKSVGQLSKTSSSAINRTSVSSQLGAFTGKKKTQEELDKEAVDRAAAETISASKILEDKKASDEQYAKNREEEKKKKKQSSADIFMASTK